MSGTCLAPKRLSVDNDQVQQLVTAARQGSFETAKRLLDQNVDPNSEYEFLAGGKKIPWKGPIMFAAISMGRLSILKLLLDYKADLGACCKLTVNGKTHDNAALWDACNAGKLEIVRFLLGREEVDVNRKGTNPDTEELVSPLHQAVIRGRCHVVEALLQVDQVDTTVRRSDMIAEAIWSEHFDIVRAFVVQSVGLKNDTDTLHGDLDSIFESGDPRAAQVSAQALQGAPAAAISCVLDHKHHERLCKFIRTPGAAPHEILNTVFRTRKIIYWDPSRNRKLRRTALLDPGEILVAIGPPAETFADKFAKVSQLTAIEEEFIRRLLPEDRGGGGSGCSCLVKRLFSKRRVTKTPVEVDVFASSIPALQDDPKILLALLEVEDSHIFEHRGCEALVRAFVQGAQSFVIMEVVLSFLLAALILALTALHSSADHPLLVRNCVLASSVACCAVQIAVEAVKFSGFCHLQRATLYFKIREVPYKLLATAYALQALYWDWGSNHAKICISIAAPINWMGVLEGLEYFSTVSQHSLPVKKAFMNSMPFFLVILFPFIAMLNAYYALGVRTFSEAIFLCYGLAFVGDLDRDNLEGIDTTFEKNDEGLWVEQDPDPTTLRIPLTLFILFTSTIVTITLLNILIGVVTMHYERAHEIKKLLHLRNNVADTLASVATLYAARVIFRRVFVSGPSTQVTPLGEAEDTARYVWYCQHAAAGDGCFKKADVIEPAPPPPEQPTSPRRSQQADLQELKESVRSLKADIGTLATSLASVQELMTRAPRVDPIGHGGHFDDDVDLT